MSHIIYISMYMYKQELYIYYNIKEQKPSFYYTSENMSNKFRNPSRETLSKFLLRCV